MRGLEPPRPYGHTDLNRARLPIPPHPRGRTILAPGRLTPSMTRLAALALSLAVALLLVARAPSSCDARRRSRPRSSSCSTRHRSRARPGRGARDRRRAARLPARARRAASRRARRLALPARRERVLGRAPERAGAAPPRRSRACGTSSPAASYAPQLDVDAAADRRAAPSGARALDTAGQGLKIGIIDSGVDHDAPVLRPDGLHDAAGIPEGAARVHDREGDRRARIPAERAHRRRARRSRSTRRLEPRHARRRHRRRERRHADGQAASPASRRARTSATTRCFVETDAGLSPNANSPAIVAAIEAAVADGMDVINFSGGEPEIEPSRDIVALALDAAAAAGVVPVVAAGNDYNEFGAGSVVLARELGARDQPSARSRSAARRRRARTPGSRPSARRRCRSGSSPTSPRRASTCSRRCPAAGPTLSGTSMAAPHVAGAAALLVQRHPAWTVEQVRSALVQTGVDAVGRRRTRARRRSSREAVSSRSQGRPAAPVRAADRACRSGCSQRGQAKEDASSSTMQAAAPARGACAVVAATRPRRASARRSRDVEVPGELAVRRHRARSAPRGGDSRGYIVLRRGAEVRRIPFWGRVTAQALARHSRRDRCGAPGVVPEHDRAGALRSSRATATRRTRAASA